MDILTLGIDLAKNVFARHGVDATGRPVLVRPSTRLAAAQWPESAQTCSSCRAAGRPPARRRLPFSYCEETALTRECKASVMPMQEEGVGSGRTTAPAGPTVWQHKSICAILMKRLNYGIPLPADCIASQLHAPNLNDKA